MNGTRANEALRQIAQRLAGAAAAVRRQPRLLIAGFLLTVFVVAAVLAPWIAPWDPIRINLRNSYAQPSAAHLLGTDSIGRDVLSRLVWGTRVTLYVAVFSVLLASACGTLVGIPAGYSGGFPDALAGRFVDILITLPSFITAVVLMGVMGRGTGSMVVAIGIGLMPRVARVARAVALSVRSRDFVEAARSYGCHGGRILLVHVFPHCIAPIVVYATLSLGSAIMLESGLSFLGLGTPPPTPTWGTMISEGMAILRTRPLISTVGGLCIMLLVLAFNLLGDGLRDALDPRTRRQLG